jgi:hypothetical protein
VGSVEARKKISLENRGKKKIVSFGDTRKENGKHKGRKSPVRSWHETAVCFSSRDGF